MQNSLPKKTTTFHKPLGTNEHIRDRCIHVNQGTAENPFQLVKFIVEDKLAVVNSDKTYKGSTTNAQKPFFLFRQTFLFIILTDSSRQQGRTKISKVTNSEL